MTRQMKDVALAVVQKLNSPVFHCHSDHNKKKKMKTPLDKGGFHAASKEIELFDPFTRSSPLKNANPLWRIVQFPIDNPQKLNIIEHRLCQNFYTTLTIYAHVTLKVRTRIMMGLCVAQAAAIIALIGCFLGTSPNLQPKQTEGRQWGSLPWNL